MSDQEVKQLEAEYILTTSLLDELILPKWTNEEYEKFKDTYLQGRVSKVSWDRYITENPDRCKTTLEYEDELVWSNTLQTWEHAKGKSVNESKRMERLVFFSHANNVIKGKPTIFDNNKKVEILMMAYTEKVSKDKKTGEEEIIPNYKFVGDHFDKRFDGITKQSIYMSFWVYQVIDAGQEYIVLMDEKLQSSEVQYFKGMMMQIENSNDISGDLKCKGGKRMFLCKSYKPTIEAMPKDEIIDYTKNFMKDHDFDQELMEKFFFDFPFTHEDGNIYRQPEDYMLMRHTQLLSGKVDGYPLSTLALGVPGCSKTMEVECINQIFQEGVMEAGNSTVKSLVPSFKERPAAPGFIMEKNRIALIDELMKMVDRQMEGNGSVSIIRNQISQLNFILEHKKRSVGSGNDNTFTGQTTAKVIMVGNPAGRYSYLHEHLKVLDESTLSRLFIWIKDNEHKRFIQSNKIVKSRNTYTHHIYRNRKNVYRNESIFRDFVYNYYLSIYDSCQAFIVEMDYAEVERLYTTTLALVPHELKNVWAARGRHHTELIIDGITKWNRIFVQQFDHFVATELDYDQAERILIKMSQNWSSGLREMH